jgi:serine O-acetyltransferase
VVTVPAEAAGVSATVADWSREHKGRFQWAPGKSLLASIRSYQAHRARRGPLASIGRQIAIVRHRWWSIVTGADMPLNAEIGGGLLIPHPNGIVIHPAARIGVNCLLFQQVTIGDARGGVPRLAGHVDVGAGAKLIGGIEIGAHAQIGANAVVVSDVPPRAIAVGVPARIVNQGHEAAHAAAPTNDRERP